MAEQEGDEYVDAVGGELFPLAQAIKPFDEPGDGAERFSLVRRSQLEAEERLDRHRDTGTQDRRPYWLPDDCRRHLRSSAMRPLVRTRSDVLAQAVDVTYRSCCKPCVCRALQTIRAGQVRASVVVS